MSEEVSVIILNYNGGQQLERCLRSVLDQTYTNYEVIVVDNASTDESVELVKRKFPNIKLIVNLKNMGYSGGNNIGIRSTNSEYVVILNPDTEVDRNWLSELVKPLKEDESVAFTTSKILDYHNKKKINTCGNLEHFTGFAFCRGIGESPDKYCKPEAVGGFSGCSFLARKKILDEIGYFDKDFFSYLEDADLSWRARLMGYKIMYVPTSIVYHRHSATLSPLKYFLLEKNRNALLMKHYNVKTLIFISPALILSEVLAWGYALKNGSSYMKAKVRAHAWTVKNLRNILEKRRSIQRLRKASDRELLNQLTHEIPISALMNTNVDSFSRNLVKEFNILFQIMYETVKHLVK